MSYKARLLLCLCLFVLETSISIAQSTQAIKFIDYLNYTQLIYQPQPNYSELNFTGRFVPDYPESSFGLSTIFYSIKYDKDDIVIGFAPMPIIKEDKDNLTNQIYPHDMNKNWLVNLKVQADTVNGKIVYLDAEKVIAINADKVVIYQLKMKQVFLGKYTYCKVLLIHKENVSDAQIFYFYNNTSKSLVDSQIKATYGVLKFKS